MLIAKSRSAQPIYLTVCLEHVRDFFAYGLQDVGIEAKII